MKSLVGVPINFLGVLYVIIVGVLKITGFHNIIQLEILYCHKQLSFII